MGPMMYVNVLFIIYTVYSIQRGSIDKPWAHHDALHGVPAGQVARHSSIRDQG